MAFILGAGAVDPRAGKTWADRQPMALVQSWEPTSELWWALGLRWHPELATKWLVGGGQFGVGQVVDEPPPPPKPIEAEAEELLEFIGKDNPEFADMLRRIREAGTPEQRQALLREFEGNITSLQKMANYIQGGADS